MFMIDLYSLLWGLWILTAVGTFASGVYWIHGMDQKGEKPTNTKMFVFCGFLLTCVFLWAVDVKETLIKKKQCENEAEWSSTTMKGLGFEDSTVAAITNQFCKNLFD
jgi:hypothetical protein